MRSVYSDECKEDSGESYDEYDVTPEEEALKHDAGG